MEEMKQKEARTVFLLLGLGIFSCGVVSGHNLESDLELRTPGIPLLLHHWHHCFVTTTDDSGENISFLNGVLQESCITMVKSFELDCCCRSLSFFNVARLNELSFSCLQFYDGHTFLCKYILFKWLNSTENSKISWWGACSYHMSPRQTERRCVFLSAKAGTHSARSSYIKMVCECVCGTWDIHNFCN